MYAVESHVLKGCELRTTEKMGRALKPRFLVIHYTAGASFKSDVATLSTSPTPASVHLVIGRSGEIVQIVPFNRVAWHAGASTWGNINGLNHYSIGIELSNAGLLKRSADGKFHSWWGEEIPQSQVFEAAHVKGGPVVGWHMYPEKQIEALFEVARALHQHYDFLEILGHDDISWPRKTDPGPAFPMGALRSRILGRS